MLLVSLISFADESDCVSVFVFQLRPRTIGLFAVAAHQLRRTDF